MKKQFFLPLAISVISQFGIGCAQEGGATSYDTVIIGARVIDPATVNGVADYAPGTSSLPSEGFVHVMVNGQIVVKDGKIVVGTFPGEAIRGEESSN